MRITQVLMIGLLGAALPVQFAIADADGEQRDRGHCSVNHLIDRDQAKVSDTHLV